MNKSKKLFSICAAALFGAMSVTALAACDKETPSEPEHVSAVAADCTQAGNIEYWTRDGKYYADEECTVEIEQYQTIEDALGHDFSGTAPSSYGKDYTGHWKICARSDCDATDTKTDHVESGICVCGYDTGEQDPDPTEKEYDITVAPAQNGSVAASAVKAAAGTEITITVTPDSGYILSTLTYSGETTAETDIKTAKSFTMPEENVTVTAAFELEQTPDPEPEVTHFDAVPATCTTAGNIEYWVKDGEYYNNSDCTDEHKISQADTVIDALDHDFENGTYGSDDAEHWKICARENCNEISAKSEHTYANNTRDNNEHEKVHTASACVCGHDVFSAYTLFEIWNNDATSHGIVRTDTVNGLAISAEKTDGEGWHIKLQHELSGVKRGHFYEITYKIKSNVEGTVWFEGGKYADDARRSAKLTVSELNTVNVRFAADNVNDGKTMVNIQFGALPQSGFDITLLEPVSVKEIKQNWEGYEFNKADGVTMDKINNEDGSVTVNVNGNGAGNSVTVKKALDLTESKKYEMIFVFSRDSLDKVDNGHNFKLYIDGAKVAFESSDLLWVDGNYNGNNVWLARFVFTAKETCTVDAAWEYGEFSNAETPLTITYTHIEFNEIA